MVSKLIVNACVVLLVKLIIENPHSHDHSDRKLPQFVVEPHVGVIAATMCAPL